MSSPTTNTTSSVSLETGSGDSGLLKPASRIWCLVGTLPGIVILVMAWLLLPYMWSHNRLSLFFRRPCMLKVTTGVPCPFCGATRSTVHAVQGHFLASFKLSPLGIPLVAASVLIMLWLGLCAATGRDIGLGRAGRVIAKLPHVRIILSGIALLWICKIIMDCVLKWD